MPSVVCGTLTGPIAGGKSSLLRALQESYDVYDVAGERSGGRKELAFNLVIVEEGADTPEFKWWLARFYSGACDALSFQCYAFAQQCLRARRGSELGYRLARETGKDSVVLIERSPLDTVHIFLPANAVLPEEAALFKSYKDLFAWNPAFVFYVRVPAEVCVERAHARARSAESSMDADYVRAIAARYDDVFESGTYSVSPTVFIDNRGHLPDVCSVLVRELCDIAARLRRVDVDVDTDVDGTPLPDKFMTMTVPCPVTPDGGRDLTPCESP